MGIFCVPEGAVYGSLLTLAVETTVGRMRNVTFAVPWGLTPGTALELWYDPNAGTVGMHPQQALRNE